MYENFIENGARRRWLLRLVRPIAIALLIIVLVLFNAFLPFRTLPGNVSVRAIREGEVRIHFLSVGEGDCAIVEYGDGRVLVIDTGDDSFSNNHRLYCYLKALHPRAVSLVLTHASFLRYGSVRDLVSLFPVDTLYLSALCKEKFQTVFPRTFYHGEVVYLSRYGVIEHENAYGVCISSRSIEEDASEDDCSLVLYFNAGGVGVLFGGTVSSAREELLTREYALMEGIFDSNGHAVRLEDVAIFQVSRHGSRYATAEKWLSLLSPQRAIIPCGRQRGSLHPAGQTVERLTEAGADIWRLDELGDVVVTFGNGEYTIDKRSDL